MDLPLIVVIGVAMFVTTFDITAVLMVMPQIRQTLGLDIGGFAWVMDAYSLAFTVCLMAAGLLADRHGRRRAFVAGNAAFLVASLACVAAPGQEWLLAARALQGVGAAFVVCGGIAIVSHRHPQPAQRARAFGLLGTLNGSAMALGPAGGGLLAQAFGWQWVFLVNVPLCLFVLVGTWRVVNESADPARRRIDLPGVASLSLWLVGTVWWLMHGLQIGSHTVPAWAAMLALTALAALFVVTQRRSRQPVFDLSLFARPMFAGICLVHLALSVGYWSVLVFLPLFLLEGLGHSQAQASLLMLAATAAMVVLPMFAARVAAATQPYRFFAAGLAAVALGGALVAAGAAMQSLAWALTGMAVAGTGTALLSSQALAGIVGAVPMEKAGAASAVTVILRQGGFALGIALLAAVAHEWPVPRGPGALMFVVAAAVTACCAVLVFVLMWPRGAAVQSVNSSPALLGGVTPR